MEVAGSWITKAGFGIELGLHYAKVVELSSPHCPSHGQALDWRLLLPPLVHRPGKRILEHVLHHANHREKAAVIISHYRHSEELGRRGCRFGSEGGVKVDPADRFLVIPMV